MVTYLDVFILYSQKVVILLFTITTIILWQERKYT
ncbi:hypothetical protein Bcop_0628 [Bacteroides coprosuis DSM 18011]|uniref:Uncharacterized protein n=1 Tax=Bacteroides coprosuis DSM 18011 TaxID=679937 RepID=F3ZSA9_9BACE|nr:hypothetical protein Bcop_0628 [Bacteroides coprosuis DSM 18011]